MTDQHNQKPNFWSILLSTFAAAFGVQSQRNREKDFSGGNIKVFIIAGIIFTASFVLCIYLLVNIVISNMT